MEENGEKLNGSNWGFRRCLKWAFAIVIVHAIVTAFWYKTAPFLLFIILFPILWMFILVMDYLVLWLPPGTIKPWLLFQILFTLNEVFCFAVLLALFWGLPRLWVWCTQHLFLLELNLPLLKSLSIPSRWACVLALSHILIVVIVWLIEYPHTKISVLLTFPALFLWRTIASFSYRCLGILYLFQDIPEPLRAILLLPISLIVDLALGYLLGIVVMNKIRYIEKIRRVD